MKTTIVGVPTEAQWRWIYDMIRNPPDYPGFCHYVKICDGVTVEFTK